MMMTKHTTKMDFWNWVTLGAIGLYTVFFILPIGNMLVQSFYTKSTGFTLKNFSKFFSQPYYFSTILNSLKVSTATTVLTLIIGTLLAYFTSVYQVRGQKFLNIIIILSSMSAPFIGAYSWILLLGRNGAITKLFSHVLGITIPEIYGFKGILLVLTLQLFPLVYLYIQGALKSVDNSLFEASENMGITGFKRFFTVVLPLTKPTIYASALLVFMRAFADFGTPMLIGEGYRTFSRLIFDQFISEVETDAGFAAAISVIAIVFTSAIFLFQRWLSNRKRFSMSALHSLESKKMKPGFGVLITGFVYSVVALASMPQLYVFYTSFLKTSGLMFVPGYSLESYRQAFTRMGNSIQNTFIIPGISLLVIIVFAVLIAYIVVRRQNTLTVAAL